MYLSSSGIAVKSFAAPEVWSTLIQVFVVLLAVLAGNTLRRKVRFLRRSLIPTALLGGLIILLFKFWPKFNDIIDKRFMETMTYHALAWASYQCLSDRPKVSNRSNTRTVVETGTLTVGTYIIQGIVGLLITVPMYLFWRNPEAGRDIFMQEVLCFP